MKTTVPAHAKVNLILDITNKRPDGYHDIRSVMQTISLCDEITIEVLPASGDIETLPATEDAESLIVNASCTNAEFFPDVKWDDSNLVVKAARLLMRDASVPLSKAGVINISVTKNIPSGAGLGGGSSDAAAVLTGLNDLLALGYTKKELCTLGAKLGADVPFCVLGGTALCEGIGEVLTPLPDAPEMNYIIEKPNVSLSTKLMYEQVDKYLETEPHPDTDKMVEAIKAGDPEFYKYIGNFMEKAAVSFCPEIEEGKKRFLERGAVASFMTGSGSAVVGLFK